MNIRVLLMSLIVLSCAACGAAEDSNTAPEPSLNPATTMIETDDGVVLVYSEVADTPEERAEGLMNRESLEEDEGMMFLYFEEHRGGFWMKDTSIPLSIAFFDRTGEIVSILDMEPCEEDPCPTYDPGKPYWGALEVNQGAFDEWGVEVGDVIRSNQ